MVVPSEATAAECRAAGFDPDRIRVVPWGVDARPATAEEVAEVRSAPRAPGPLRAVRRHARAPQEPAPAGAAWRRPAPTCRSCSPAPTGGATRGVAGRDPAGRLRRRRPTRRALRRRRRVAYPSIRRGSACPCSRRWPRGRRSSRRRHGHRGGGGRCRPCSSTRSTSRRHRRGPGSCWATRPPAAAGRRGRRRAAGFSWDAAPPATPPPTAGRRGGPTGGDRRREPAVAGAGRGRRLQETWITGLLATSAAHDAPRGRSSSPRPWSSPPTRGCAVPGREAPVGRPAAPARVAGRGDLAGRPPAGGRRLLYHPRRHHPVLRARRRWSRSTTSNRCDPRQLLAAQAGLPAGPAPRGRPAARGGHRHQRVHRRRAVGTAWASRPAHRRVARRRSTRPGGGRAWTWSSSATASTGPGSCTRRSPTPTRTTPRRLRALADVPDAPARAHRRRGPGGGAVAATWPTSSASPTGSSAAGPDRLRPTSTLSTVARWLRVPVRVRGRGHPRARGDGLGLPGDRRRRHRPAVRRRQRRRPGSAVGRRRGPPPWRRSTTTGRRRSSPPAPAGCSGWAPAASARKLRRRLGAGDGDDPPMQLLVLCPHFTAGHGTDRHGDDPDRRGARRPGPPPARRDRPAVVPAPPHRARLGRAASSATRTSPGVGSPGPPVPDRQAQHPGPGAWVRGLHRRVAAVLAALSGPAADAVLAMSPPLTLGPGRGGRRPAAAGPVRVQHPGRVPRRRRRDRGPHQPAG